MRSIGAALQRQGQVNITQMVNQFLAFQDERNGRNIKQKLEADSTKCVTDTPLNSCCPFKDIEASRFGRSRPSYQSF